MVERGATFNDLISAFLADEFDARPTFATALGVSGYDDRLPDYFEDSVHARERRDDRWLQRFSQLEPADLSRDEHIDRDLVVMMLRGRQLMRDWAGWRRYPDTYTQPALSGVFDLLLHRLHPETELAASTIARLRAVPELLECGIENLSPDLAPVALVERAQRQASLGAEYVRNQLPGQFNSDRARREVADAAEVAAAAFLDFGKHLADLATHTRGEYAIGEELYSALLTQREGLSYGASELRERGRAAYAVLEEDIRRRTRDLTGHDDWRTYVEELTGDHPADPADMRERYYDWTMRCRQFCIDHDLVTLPEGEECKVEPSPPFQRPMLAVAYYVPPPPFADTRTGHFFVPYPVDGATPEQIEQRLRTNSIAGIPTTSAHEAYPGHHWHLAWLAATSKRTIRTVLGTAYFAEGWALYAEELMKEQGFFTDPRHELMQVEARLFRAARIVVDTSLHIGDMSVDEAVEFMSTKSGLSLETARAEVTRYCAWPTQASSYLTGALEIQRMRDTWLEQNRGSLRDFHDACAGSGELPIGLVWRALFD